MQAAHQQSVKFPSTGASGAPRRRPTPYPLRTLVAFAAMAAVAGSAQAALVLHLPLNDASSGGVTSAAAAINDSTHPTTSATSTGTGDAWMSDPTRGNVYFSNQGSRLNAGTQGIDRAVGFTWSMWVNVDPTAAGNSDAGADVLIGTRTASGGNWHKVQSAATDNWTGISYGANSLATNTWRHIAYLGDATNVRMYVDGAFAGQDTTTPTTTFNGVFEIGSSSTFTEDSEGLFSDVGVWTGALTGDEVKGLFDVSKSSPGLLYDVAEFDQLKQVHDAAAGSVVIDGLTWNYATGLTGDAGLTSSGPTYTLVLDAMTDTGLVAVPEPSTLALLGLSGMTMLRRRRVARR